MMRGAPDSQVSVVRLVYLARLREALGASHERYAVDGATTVGAIRETLRTRGGAWESELAPGRALRVAVNHDLATADTPVAPGDEVAFFPPVTGG
ncbi:Molybdopterin synthase sulfur carrier subunit [Burkholderiales bacterium]|nr:Molybdopterin synthase sulfur carrier subunit [Burkholderiales bacterium]